MSTMFAGIRYHLHQDEDDGDAARLTKVLNVSFLRLVDV